jgi:hypothetical protein
MTAHCSAGALLLATLVTAGSLHAQPKRPRAPAEPPTADSLAAVSQRGRTLAEYDSVSWLGSGVMTSLSLPPDSIRRLIARKTSRGWEVAAGSLGPSGETFLMSHLSIPGIEAGPVWATTSFDPAQEDSGYFARAARAIETSVTMFRAAARPYIATVVPASDGPWWWVYLYPAPSRPGAWPRGGDMRFRVSADGRVITESRHLHESITEYTPRTARSGGEVEREMLADTPEDTDVFHVVQRRPALPELMTAGRFRYRIDVNGTIRLIGVR